MSKKESAAPEKVEIFIPRGQDKDDPNLFVSVNGVNYLLPKGKTSLVPPEVAAEIERSRQAAERFAQTKEQLLEQGAQSM